MEWRIPCQVFFTTLFNYLAGSDGNRTIVLRLTAARSTIELRAQYTFLNGRGSRIRTHIDGFGDRSTAFVRYP